MATRAVHRGPHGRRSPRHPPAHRPVATWPAVAHAAVIGVPDEEWGERLRAFVVAHPGQTLSCPDLRAHCKETLSGPKVPREWAFVEALPTNSTGKVLKRELRGYDGPIERV